MANEVLPLKNPLAAQIQELETFFPQRAMPTHLVANIYKLSTTIINAHWVSLDNRLSKF